MASLPLSKNIHESYATWRYLRCANSKHRHAYFMDLAVRIPKQTLIFDMVLCFGTPKVSKKTLDGVCLSKFENKRSKRHGLSCAFTHLTTTSLGARAQAHDFKNSWAEAFTHLTTTLRGVPVRPQQECVAVCRAPAVHLRALVPLAPALPSRVQLDSSENVFQMAYGFVHRRCQENQA